MNKFLEKFILNESLNSQLLYNKCLNFLVENNFDFNLIKTIDVTQAVPLFIDFEKNKFSIDFINNKTNYHKKKSGIKSEILSKALGGGRYGLRVLDLSAGLAVDAVFLSQLGYSVTAVERNPLIYLALIIAYENLDESKKSSLKFEFSEALSFLSNTQLEFDVIYFDPMFPHKVKTALPKQEMIFFRKLVGDDKDSLAVLKQALLFKNVKRVVVKRPLKATPLTDEFKIKPQSQILGKLVRFDIYGVNL